MEPRYHTGNKSVHFHDTKALRLASVRPFARVSSIPWTFTETSIPNGHRRLMHRVHQYLRPMSAHEISADNQHSNLFFQVAATKKKNKLMTHPQFYWHPHFVILIATTQIAAYAPRIQPKQIERTTSRAKTIMEDHWCSTAMNTLPIIRLDHIGICWSRNIECYLSLLSLVVTPNV